MFQGDSGGPLVHNNTLIGIVSFGPNSCDDTIVPELFTSVPFYLDFIYRAMASISDKSDMLILK